MMEIKIQKSPTDKQLTEMGIKSWPVWTKEKSTFPWDYSESETCYFLEGEVVVTPEGSPPVKMGKGDLVTFPSGMSCQWEILSPVKKHYKFNPSS